ncbi:hypothetical protein [Streptomyces erythrochromogenes]|uniref:hypothetical protein n=1 Tax=Streptomyces erythrochromogenes TaxID=285574 RepID=UPI003870C261|nr:hypothetical protein OG364_00905 [Streptomyces erythrochromogenes]WST98369.1 hypothetical protein OG364_40630 [Streptomyces erythrochromogenes]
MGEETRERRLAVVLWPVLAVEVAGLVGTFTLADTTVLVPEYDGILVRECAALLVLALAVLTIVVAVLALRDGRNTTAVWRAAASWILALALLVILLRAGTGLWVVWCAVTMAASCVATVLCTDSATELPVRPSRAAAVIAVVALVAAVSGSCSGPYTDYPGVWTAPKSAASLTLTETGQGGRYTLRVGTCTEQGRWVFDYPQMSTSVQMWLHREGTLSCVPTAPETWVRIVGGNRAAPVIALPGLLLTKQ